MSFGYGVVDKVLSLTNIYPYADKYKFFYSQKDRRSN